MTKTEKAKYEERLESARRENTKLQAKIKELEKALYRCWVCDAPTPKPLSLGRGVIVCSKTCRMRAARILGTAK